MAETLVYKIVIQDNVVPNYPTWEEEDELKVYYDDVLDSIRVYDDDDVEIFDGPSINLSGPPATDVKLRDQNYSFCDGSDLVQFNPVAGTIKGFPYIEKVVTTNSPTCTATTCTLRITSVVTTPADSFSGTGTAEILINESLPFGEVQYSIDNVNFFNTNVFNRPVGTHTAYVRQTNGCRDQFEFTVEAEKVYQELYTSEFDFRGSTAKVVIETLSGLPVVSEEVCLANFVGITYPNQSFESIYDYAIRPSYLEVSLLSDSQEKYIDLFTSNPQQHRLTYYIDGQEEWRGFMVPSIFSQPYRDAPYSTSLTFTDQLKMLDRIELDVVNLKKRNSLIRILTELLSYTGLELPIHESINVYAQGMNSSQPMLSQAYLEFETLSRAGNIYEAIEWILKPFGAELVQQQGAWWIVRKEYRTMPFDYFVFNTLGAYSGGQGTYNPVKNYNSAEVANRITNKNSIPTLDVMPSYGKITFTNKLDLRKSLISNHNFEEYTIDENGRVEFDGWTWVSNGVNNVWLDVAFTSDFSASAKMRRTFALSDITGQWPSSRNSYIYSAPFRVRYDTDDLMRFRFKFSYDRLDAVVPYLIIRTVVKVGDNYLNNAGKWESSFTELRFYPTPTDGFGEVKIEALLPNANSAISNPVTEICEVRIHAYWSTSPEYDEVDGSDDITLITTTDKTSGYKIDVLADNISTRPDTFSYFELEEFTGDDINDIGPDKKPSDYNETTNNKYWKRTKNVETGILHNFQFVIDEVEFDYLPDRYEPIEEQTYEIYNDALNLETYNAEMNVGDLPINNLTEEAFISQLELTPNDIYNYRSQFTNVINEYLEKWGRKDIDEADRLQFLYNNTIIAQHQTPTRRITGTFTSQEMAWLSGIVLRPLDSIYNSFDQKYYLVEGYASADVNHYYDLEMIESKSGESINEFREHTTEEHTNNEHS